MRGPTRTQAWIAQVVAPVRAFARPRPSTPLARLGVRARWAGGPNQLLVLAARRDRLGRRWLRVRLPRRPNDAAGWIRADRTVLTRTRWRLELDLGERRLRVLRAGRVRRSLRAVVGAPGTPTPRGRFAIAEMVRQPRSARLPRPVGAAPHRALRRARRLRRRPGTVAIHGRGGASLLDPLGSARSHGCIRIDNRHIRFLARVLVPGTPVIVTA